MIEGSILQEDITIINMYAPNNRAPKIREAKTDRIEVNTGSLTVIVGYFTTPLLVMARTI